MGYVTDRIYAVRKWDKTLTDAELANDELYIGVVGEGYGTTELKPVVKDKALHFNSKKDATSFIIYLDSLNEFNFSVYIEEEIGCR